MKYQLPKHVSLTEIDNSAVLLDLDKGHYYGLNHIGAEFLNLITKNLDHDKAITKIAQNYTIDYNQVKDDINELIAQLMEQNLLQNVKNDHL